SLPVSDKLKQGKITANEFLTKNASKVPFEQLAALIIVFEPIYLALICTGFYNYVLHRLDLATVPRKPTFAHL
ncbi:hypothetical protein ACJX0J_038513, partial [Zea mays]